MACWRPVREAVESVDEVRMTVERAMFLLTKMQLIMGFQVELVYRNLVRQPEMKTMLNDISDLKESANRYAVLLEKLPRQVSEEHKAILDVIDDKAAAIHAVNTDVQATLRQADFTLKSLQQDDYLGKRFSRVHGCLAGAFSRPDESADPVTMDGLYQSDGGPCSKQYQIESNQLISTVDQTGMPLIIERARTIQSVCGRACRPYFLAAIDFDRSLQEGLGW